MVGLVLMVVCVVPVWVFGVWAWWSGRQHQPPPVLATLHADGQRGDQLAWSPDGKYLAEQITLPGAAAGDPKGAAVIIWDIASGQEVRRFTGGDGGLTFAWSPDSALLATSDGSHTLIWRTLDITAPGNTARPVAALAGHSKYDQISALAFGKDAQALAVADDGGVDLFQAAGGGSWKQLLYVPDSLCATTPCTRSLSWSPDGSWLLAAPWHLSDGTSGVGALDTRTWKQAAFLNASAPLAWSPDSAEVLVRASDETTLSALRTSNWTTAWSINPNNDIHQGYNVYPQAAGWSPDNEWLVGSADGWVDLWPLSTRESAWVWNEQHANQHIYAVNSLAWSPDAHSLALTTDGTANVTLYDMSNPSPPL
jgi:WD40 repeat protein